MKSPIVEFLTPDQSKEGNIYTEDELFDMGMINVINNASWKSTDIILATPTVLCHIIEIKEKYDPYDINPKVIVLDEFDSLFLVGT